MKKMIAATLKRPYTVTEGLLCVTTGIMLLLAFGLPQIARTPAVICSAVFMVLAIVTGLTDAECDTTRKDGDTIFFFGSAVICLLAAIMLGKHPVMQIMYAALLMNAVYGVYKIAASFTAEPPDSTLWRRNGFLRFLFSFAAFVLLKMIF